jgi:hypothetical protein
MAGSKSYGSSGASSELSARIGLCPPRLRFKKSFYPCGQGFAVLHLAFPHYHDMPSGTSQLSGGEAISQCVSAPLLVPECLIT